MYLTLEVGSWNIVPLINLKKTTTSLQTWKKHLHTHCGELICFEVLIQLYGNSFEPVCSGPVLFYWIAMCCRDVAFIVSTPLYATLSLLETVLNFSGEEAVKANTNEMLKTLLQFSFLCLWFRNVGGSCVLPIRLVQQEARWHSSYVTAYDRQMWQTEQQVSLLRRDERSVSPRRMDWFKLQRFEKVFNASSTRIVTKKGVKWVTWGWNVFDDLRHSCRNVTQQDERSWV